MSRFPGRDIAAVALLLAALGAAAIDGVLLLHERADHRAIAALAKGTDVPVAPDASGAVLAARGLFLVRNGRIEEAQILVDRISEHADAAARAALLYALGNAHLRRAVAIFATAPTRRVAPIVNLAKSEYRQSLRLDPGNWDARYNYDVAASMVRDADPPPTKEGQEMAHDRARFPDLPGAPNGMP